MQFLKLLLLLLALAAVAFMVKLELTGTVSSSDSAAATQPKRQLDHVRQRAAELGDELQRNANRADRER